MLKARLGQITLESGEVLSEVEVGYQTYGTYEPEKGNAVLVCHALTGDVYAAGDGERQGWWDGLIGPGKVVDTNKYFVICSNVLGGCYGTTGPASICPETGKPYGSSFPVVTIRDMVRVQRRLLSVLGVERLYAVIGGSMGGMQVYEWLVEYPDMMDVGVPIATCARMSAVGIAYNDVGRQAICSDPEWKDGDYYPGEGPRQGLSIARMVGMLTYRTAELFEERFGRNLRDSVANPLTDSVFEIESYLRYQGEKLVKRFDANSYLYLLKAMDTHDIGRDRGGLKEAIAHIKARVLAIGIVNDLIYPVDHQQEMVALMKQCGVDVEFYTIESKYGHDAFLVDFPKFAPLLEPYFT
ncbi:homoserine O-acetyltransferase [Brevibacillus sp. SYP-B805]|uniref:homoserine O-acetyltransferase MetX n=1 Tax=Brevibacillus sp. SYP-B805 TaxID=1578199 RepID=UPI0013EAF750|nr:homoserine O-acetyltransferase [Brevibacillus sp. SYP-B805]NGQ94411.1 homoserine O-acetyltransferase [Brevibacillus sp. SYP-B805]